MSTGSNSVAAPVVPVKAAPRADGVRLPDESELARVLESALREDVGPGDITTRALVRHDQTAVASVVYKQAAVVAGMPVLARVFKAVDRSLEVSLLLEDGSLADHPPAVAAVVRGSAASILTAERTALNLLQRLSAIATATRRFAEVAGQAGIAVLDTRKTTPGLRALEKYAVRVGGGQNHRFGLFDAVLIKDNHLRVAGGVAQAVRLARQSNPGKRIEVENTTLDEVEQSLAAGVDAILLDNMSPELIGQAVRLVSGRCYLEVSGGVTLKNIHRYLIPGVDAISVGALTHSAGNVDISLEVEY
jgi:nicotinate-nucleotide pyrophosphorylase (carboxylating)